MPVTINGRIAAPGAENRYRFTAHKGEQLVLEVNARRLGSDLDSYLEVLDAKGKPIERAVVRPVWETSVTLRDHDSAGRGIRIAAWDGLQAGDYVMVGGEIIRVEALPLSPDNDTVFEGFGGQRLAFFDTTAEAHAIDSAVYKVQILSARHQALAQRLAGRAPLLPQRRWRPRLRQGFAAALHRAGGWRIHVRHSRRAGAGRRRLCLPPHRPAAASRFPADRSPRNPNVPVGGTIPVTVTAFRMDGFDGPIDVALARSAAGPARHRAA